jgi:transcriptional regulator with PAS, ATPase and Fis domain
MTQPVQAPRDGYPRSDLPTLDLEELIWLTINEALARTQGNRTHAAKLVGISVRTLQRYLKDGQARHLPADERQIE